MRTSSGSSNSSKHDRILPPPGCPRLEKLLGIHGRIPQPSIKKSGMSNTSPTVPARKSQHIPVAMRQAPVKNPSELHEVYTSETATLSRSKSRIQMILHDDPVTQKPVAEETLRPQTQSEKCAPEICEMAEKLKTQVSDLSLFLEEERLKHKDTRRIAEEILRDKVSQLKSDNKSALYRQRTEYEAKIEAIKAQHQQQLTNERLEMTSTIAKLKTEMEILSGAFHSYKAQTELSHQGELTEWEERLTSTLKSKHEDEIKELENLLRYDHNIEVNSLEQKQQKKVNELKQEQKRQVEAMKSRYANHEGDLQNLKDVQEQLETITKQLASTTEQVEAYQQQLSNMKVKYSDSKLLLMNHEAQLGDKINDIEAKYKAQNDKLLEANSTLRVQYLKKCEDLFEKVAEVEVKKEMTASDSKAKQNCRREYRLVQSQSLLEMSELSARGYSKALFAQLHVHNLNDDLHWWLNYTNHFPNISVQPIPMSKDYESIVLREAQNSSRFPPLVTCHQTRNMGSWLNRKSEAAKRAIEKSSRRTKAQQSHGF